MTAPLDSKGFSFHCVDKCQGLAGVSLEGFVPVEGLQNGRKANFLHSSLACSEGMVGRPLYSFLSDSSQ